MFPEKTFGVKFIVILNGFVVTHFLLDLVTLNINSQKSSNQNQVYVNLQLSFYYSLSFFYFYIIIGCALNHNTMKYYNSYDKFKMFHKQNLK